MFGTVGWASGFLVHTMLEDRREHQNKMVSSGSFFFARLWAIHRPQSLTNTTFNIKISISEIQFPAK